MPLTIIDESTALLLVDLQEGLAAAPTAPQSGKEVIQRAAVLAEAFRSTNRPVVLARVTLTADGSDAPPGRIDASRAPRPMPSGWDQIAGELADHATDIGVVKHTWDAFIGTGLELELRRRSVTQVVLGGLMTSGAVESTARTAHDLGFSVTLPRDVMADRNVELHEHALEEIFPRLGHVTTCDRVIAALGQATAD